jgi:hypothetical protein
LRLLCKLKNSGHDACLTSHPRPVKMS